MSSAAFIDTAAWHWPEILTAFGAQSFRFADLGVPTQEFSGRRLKAEFSINLPSDFYATEYGEAILHLDAAYTAAVRPGSHINVFVNGMISTQMTITKQGDIVRRHTDPAAAQELQIRHQPRHHRGDPASPMPTSAARRGKPCRSRTASFSSTPSTLEFPTYGRIGRVPDLAVMSTGSFPDEDRSDDHHPGASRPAELSAAGTLARPHGAQRRHARAGAVLQCSLGGRRIRALHRRRRSDPIGPPQPREGVRASAYDLAFDAYG